LRQPLGLTYTPLQTTTKWNLCVVF